MPNDNCKRIKAYADGICKEKKMRLTAAMKGMSGGSVDGSDMRSRRYTNCTRAFSNLPLGFVVKLSCVSPIEPQSASPPPTKRANKGGKSDAYHTRDCQAVSDPSTNRARRCATCQTRRVRVHSTWYGGRQEANLAPHA